MVFGLHSIPDKMSLNKIDFVVCKIRKFTSYPLFTWELLGKMCSSKTGKSIKKKEVMRSREW